ncbi:hypothetical protein GCM10015535_68720 [Streptomyces gelaticus]|uniref:Uncharacterized protein n=1 Tax=Streptomyces gelaticus TaxID=285446 RepID=A0ABQ2WC53_9ACTN|nr:hypothetical protein GCM10015535_68720 [Streptomyces gelaticus]
MCAPVDVPDGAGKVIHRMPGASRAGRRGAEEERVVASQNCLVDALELLAGVDAQFVGEPYAHGGEGLQRIALPLDRVQGTHAQAQQRFVERVGRRERGQLVKGFTGAPESDQALQPSRLERAAALRQQLPLALGERAGQPGQRLSS